MWNLHLKGYDSLIIGQEISVPDIFTLSAQPMFINIDFEEAYKNSSRVVRELLERVPLRGGYKYTMATSIVQFLSPSTSSIQNAMWHLDPGVPAPHKHDARLHIFCSGYNLTSTTKFIEKGIDIEMPDELFEARHRVLREYLTSHADEWGFKETPISPNRFVTFTNTHPHIALPPEKYELRYFLRIQESDIEPPREFNMVRDTKTLLNNGTEEMIVTFNQSDNGIFLRLR